AKATLIFSSSSASTARSRPREASTAASAAERRNSSLPHSGNSCSIDRYVLLMRGPLVRSTSSDIARKVGSSSCPAASARAAAASVSSATARSSGLSRRPRARTLSTVAPGAPASCADAGPLPISAATIATARPPQYDELRMSLRQLDRDGPTHRFGLALHFGRKGEHPLARHAGL